MQAEGFNMAEEVPADGLYKLDVETLEVTRIHAWPLMLMVHLVSIFLYRREMG